MAAIHICLILIVVMYSEEVLGQSSQYYPSGPIGRCRNEANFFFQDAGYYNNAVFQPYSRYNDYDSSNQFTGFNPNPYGNRFNGGGFGGGGGGGGGYPVDANNNPIVGADYGVDTGITAQKRLCNCNCAHQNWVCGNDGLSYINRCALDCEATRYKRFLGLQYWGPCQFYQYRNRYY